MAGKYKYIYNPNHPRSNSNGCVYEHILISERKLGRLLNSEEVVHHIDDNKENNNPNNLIVFKTKADHTSFHHGGELIKLDDGTYITKKKYTKTNKNYKVDICPICNKEYKDISAKMCKKCYNNKLQENLLIKTKDQLINDFIENASNKVAVSRKYNVCQTTVRKWCKKYGIKDCLININMSKPTEERK